MHTTFTRLAAGSFVTALVLTAGVTVGAGATPDTPAHRLVTGPGQDLLSKPQVLLGGAGGGGGGGGGGAGSLHRTME
ncbi:hypothetical protein [Ornithinimicrobium pekingense]|uniref:Uncharacterized protein n=1 Tax=Ornithinimicrobium pekingense TaxID=384677 RepID=A0ABQ2FAC4_9MICO|nr:hypothetical protein [Ornithinimicrobium pekingense]GGK76295.1 hypothetical protein GCM10011509_26120 [Ornithinimicrobium pekingense]